MKQSKVVLHVESDNLRCQKETQFSLSTKIADCLMSGTPLLAFGPRNIASIDYLVNNNCVLVATNEYELEIALKRIDMGDFNDVLLSAKKTALKNHLKYSNQQKLYDFIELARGDKNNESTSDK